MRWSGVRIPPCLLSFSSFMDNLDRHKFGGRPQDSTNLLLLISELEGVYQNLKYMGFGKDLDTIDEMKKRYYSLYFKTKKEEKANNPL
jgi:hypothetical protein